MKTLTDRLKSLIAGMVMTIALFAFASCSNTGQGMKEDYNENTEEIEDAAEETGEDIEEAAEEAGDEIEEETDDMAD